ncbi:hypothetical protein PREVCOP_06585 [Segatella copri DSM 18205]|uniref:Uncharacterized protein n=1 Tax=Segatella copri DSM 18205 TaxID=537011 RepID=D1PH65_9BACT|nr:hypothetical protein PREVCOP_06585 [Segatella copri DSM 18205]
MNETKRLSILKDTAMQAEGYGSVNRRIRLRKLKNTTPQVKEDV